MAMSSVLVGQYLSGHSPEGLLQFIKVSMTFINKNRFRTAVLPHIPPPMSHLKDTRCREQKWHFPDHTLNHVADQGWKRRETQEELVVTLYRPYPTSPNYQHFHMWFYLIFTCHVNGHLYVSSVQNTSWETLLCLANVSSNFRFSWFSMATGNCGINTNNLYSLTQIKYYLQAELIMFSACAWAS